ncbi:F-box domain [Arabidopsis suecica]|uniref:F-box domain n=1 Tax=Arabidopsis suecica TaxID=45249 RepID=A0A8T2B8Z4_ARASU|nr:F-box domain [Arabidopsis suecica]
MEIPEVTLVNVLVRFPLKSIARFRSVSKEWKLLIDSDFFRDLYISLNSSSSISWSIIQTKPQKLTLEIVGHHGCERWGLSCSPGSLVSFFAETPISKLNVLACTDGLVSICAETSDGSPMYYIGNPLLQEWFRIPQPPFRNFERLRKHERFSDSGLVTKMKNGTWDRRNVTCVHTALWTSRDKSIALNGILHWLSNLTSSIIAYDFYGGHDDGFCIIHFPGVGKDDDFRRFKRTFTTSEGSIVYFNEFLENVNRTLRVWRLVKYTDGPEAWQLFREVSLVPLMESGINYIPVVMHPLNSEIIYFWSRNKKGLILFNLRTQVFSLHKETEDVRKCMDGCVLSFNCMFSLVGCTISLDRILLSVICFKSQFDKLQRLYEKAHVRAKLKEEEKKLVIKPYLNFRSLEKETNGLWFQRIESEVEDRISQLPDPLLSQILNHLTTEEAVRSSVLSTRWRTLWLWVPNLEFSFSKFPSFNAFILRLEDIVFHNEATFERLVSSCPVLEDLKIDVVWNVGNVYRVHSQSLKRSVFDELLLPGVKVFREL